MFQSCTALFTTVILAANTNASVPTTVDFASLITDVNAIHSQIDAPSTDISDYCYDFPSDKPLFTTEDGKLIMAYDGKRPSPDSQISISDAKEEVQWIFRLLRTQYGLYEYSGGDKVFENAENTILSAISNSTSISIGDYEKLLVDNLSFIKDAHFMINRSNMWHSQTVYTNQDRPFFYKDGNFYADESFTEKVISVNGRSPEEVIHRAIGPEGELTWYLYTTAPKANSINVTIQYKGKMERVVLYPTYSFEKQEPKTERFGILEMAGIPVVEINEMFFGDDDSSGWANLHDEPFKQKVLQTADDLRQYPVAIIDISHNPGGNGDLPDQWFLSYTGKVAQPNYSILRVRPGDSWLQGAYGAQDEKDIASTRAWQDEIYLGQGLEVKDNYYIDIPSKQFVSNDGHILFVLTSRNTNSAAEGFTDLLHNLENTVIIGSNTGGVLTNGANYQLKLPYSGLPFQFGECLFLWDKDYFEEGRGMTPDIYLTGDNLDYRLTQFLERYVNG